ncbi:hypothetical protein [Chitinophaga sp. 212800010-3]|uniref:hypothetical protein n=1 Tax=unclassified Chitinophaga TaxID=2619133 RepID=UPI002DEAC980|nr:hypothetical protein [Chitinophaga sp. 212800010-3]
MQHQEVILDFKEQRAGRFLIPAFRLHAGEIVVIKIPGGPFFRETVQRFVKTLVPGAGFAFIDSLPQRRFLPSTVQQFVRKNAGPRSALITELYAIPEINENSILQHLSSCDQKIVSLYTHLSSTNKILFDFAGISPYKENLVFTTIQRHVQPDGGALLFDHCDEFRDQCNSFIEAILPAG